jgi:basic membrane protein A
LKRRSITLVVLIAAFALIAAACSSDDGGSDGGDFKVAIVAPSASNDLAFTQSMVDAANILLEDGTIGEVAITDGTFVVDDAAVAIRDYASEGYDLVIGHGSQYGGSISEIAKDFPETAFAWGTSADTFGLANVSSYEAASDQGGRVMGIMAAALSQADNVGIVGPIEVGDAKLYVDGFKAGVLANKPSATVNVNYIDSFSDVALASEAAQSLIGAGADVLSGTAQMVVGAVGVAARVQMVRFVVLALSPAMLFAATWKAYWVLADKPVVVHCTVSGARSSLSVPGAVAPSAQ